MATESKTLYKTKRSNPQAYVPMEKYTHLDWWLCLHELNNWYNITRQPLPIYSNWNTGVLDPVGQAAAPELEVVISTRKIAYSYHFELEHDRLICLDDLEVPEGTCDLSLVEGRYAVVIYGPFQNWIETFCKKHNVETFYLQINCYDE